MSNQQLDDQRERRQTELVASALGLPVEELDAQEWSLEPNVGNDDILYGYVVTLENGQKAYITLPEE